MLDRVAASRGEALPVPDPVDFIDDRHRGVAGQKEIAMQGMWRPFFDGAGRCDEGLRDDKAAEHPLPANLRAASAINIFLDPLEIEDCQKLGDRVGHGTLNSFMGAPREACQRIRHSLEHDPKKSQTFWIR